MDDSTKFLWPISFRDQRCFEWHVAIIWPVSADVCFFSVRIRPTLKMGVRPNRKHICFSFFFLVRMLAAFLSISHWAFLCCIHFGLCLFFRFCHSSTCHSCCWFVREKYGGTNVICVDWHPPFFDRHHYILFHQLHRIVLAPALESIVGTTWLVMRSFRQLSIDPFLNGRRWYGPTDGLNDDDIVHVRPLLPISENSTLTHNCLLLLNRLENAELK